MSLKSVHENLLKIKDTSSTNDKILLLTEMLQNKEFRTVIELTYDAFKHYSINKLTFVKSQTEAFAEKPSNQELFAFLEKLALQKGTSNSDKNELSRIASMDKETFDVVKRIVNKDAKMGAGIKLINKACPDLIFLMPYCRCSTAKKKMGNIDYGTWAIGQEKADGIFVNIIIDKDGSSLIRSRNGNIVHQMEHLHEFFKTFPKKYWNTVYMGELLIRINGKILPRKTGNGILNSCLQNAAPHDKAEHAIVKLWDAVPQEDFWAGSSEIGYRHRLGRISKLVKTMSQPGIFGLVRTKMLYSLKEAQAFYKELRGESKEGAIIKNMYAKWKDHTSPDMCKMKNVADIELRVIGWKYGKEDTRFKDCMGSVQCESEDGLVKVSISGFTDADRLENWDERVGKIVSIEYEGLISDKSRPGLYSLYLPRFDEMRPDRSYADTYEDLKTR
jgi:DNA ligase-1